MRLDRRSVYLMRGAFARRLGAQHPGGGGAALLDHLPLAARFRPVLAVANRRCALGKSRNLLS